MKLPNLDKPVFDNYGGCYHLRLSGVEDLAHLLTLDDGRWMATSCPLFGLNVDPAFLKFLDADGNGRIISDEVRAAVRWSLERLHRSETWTTRQSHLPLHLINTDHPDGKALESAACCLLENLKLNDAQEITLEQVQNCQKVMAQAAYNGDGVIPPEVVEDAEAAQFARDLIATFGGVPDASGLKGVNEALLDQFKKEASAYLQWHAQGIIPEGETATEIMPFGAATPAMFQAVAAIRDKVEQFFIQCALIRFDPRTGERMRLQDEELAKFDYSNQEAIRERLRIAPLAAPTSAGVLPLAEGATSSIAGRSTPSEPR
ncbi:hypothetical protein HYR99_17135 [Candidatus Poribacteria bacterium]|nr:hypothetical protein [Candidatus Poribacteria bacterium]